MTGKEWNWKNLDSATVTTASIGTDDNPVDLYARAAELNLEKLMGDGATAYVETFEVEAEHGRYVITADDGAVLVKYVEADE